MWYFNTELTVWSGSDEIKKAAPCKDDLGHSMCVASSYQANKVKTANFQQSQC